MHLIPYATHAKADSLIVAGAVNIGIVVGQFAVPSEARKALCTTPPATEVANEAVCTIDVAEATAREACESAFIGSACVGGIPTCGGFHFTSCYRTL